MDAWLITAALEKINWTLGENLGVDIFYKLSTQAVKLIYSQMNLDC